MTTHRPINLASKFWTHNGRVLGFNAARPGFGVEDIATGRVLVNQHVPNGQPSAWRTRATAQVIAGGFLQDRPTTAVYDTVADARQALVESVEPISYYDAGRAAFAAGLPCIPLADGIVLAAVRILPVGAGAADIMRDWTNGWTDANLAAPIEDGE